MPNGLTHLRLWQQHRPHAVIGSLIFSGIGFSLMVLTGVSWFIFLGALYLLGYFIGYYIDPDLDQESTTSAKWRMMKHFKIFGAFLAGWFIPYGYLFKHRSTASHFPGLSTFIRMLWVLAFPINCVLVYLFVTEGFILPFLITFFGIWAGLTTADAVHTFADWGIIRVRRGR